MNISAKPKYLYYPILSYCPVYSEHFKQKMPVGFKKASVDFNSGSIGFKKRCTGRTKKIHLRRYFLKKESLFALLIFISKTCRPHTRPFEISQVRTYFRPKFLFFSDRSILQINPIMTFLFFFLTSIITTLIFFSLSPAITPF